MERNPTVIVGSKGSMGERYQAILTYLGFKFTGVDIETSTAEILDLVNHADRAIVCTPTHTHYDLVKLLIPLKRPILCEKPISKKIKQVIELYDLAAKHGTNLKMVFQYKELLGHGFDGPTRYDYFRHGKDGLAWDCLQIIALGTGDVSLKETSPVWGCTINGQPLNIKDMDTAYITMIRNWLSGSLIQTPEEIIQAHIKTEKYYEAYYK